MKNKVVKQVTDKKNVELLMLPVDEEEVVLLDRLCIIKERKMVTY